MPDILIIDDDGNFRQVARLILQDVGYTVAEVTCPEEAFALLMTGARFETILCDLRMPFTTGRRQAHYPSSYDVGYKTAKELAWAVPDSKVVVLSALPPADIMRLVPYLHPIQAFSKPTAPRDLLSLVGNEGIVH